MDGERARLFGSTRPPGDLVPPAPRRPQDPFPANCRETASSGGLFPVQPIACFAREVTAKPHAAGPLAVFGHVPQWSDLADATRQARQFFGNAGSCS